MALLQPLGQIAKSPETAHARAGGRDQADAQLLQKIRDEMRSIRAEEDAGPDARAREIRRREQEVELRAREFELERREKEAARKAARAAEERAEWELQRRQKEDALRM